MTTHEDTTRQHARPSIRTYVTVFVVAAVVGVAAAAIVIGVTETRGDTAATATSSQLFTEPHIVFRSLEHGTDFSRLSYVAADDPDGDRNISEHRCLRVAAAATSAVCLRSGGNPAQPYEVALMDANLEVAEDEALNGVPSRARMAADGEHYASTVFVSGHNYISLGFSTETIIYQTGGELVGNLEDFTFLLNGEENDNVDRNIWGVTFAADSNTFFATVATGGRTYLAQGDVSARTLTAVRENAECPSLSPDGTTVVYKKRVSPSADEAWRFHAFDLETGEETELGETRSVDDQVAWLDDEHIMYAVPKTGDGPSSADIWVAPIDGGEPDLLIPDADSPTVVGLAG